jgi:NADH dehydrogenase
MSDGNKNTNATPKRVLILGGGFGGLYAALEIERTLARDANVQVTLVSSDNFFLFTPLLHEVAASDVDITHIVNPLHKLLRRVNFFCGDVEAIDLPDRRVRVSHGSTPPHSHELEYDHLVLALGAVTNFFGTPGVAERSQGQGALGDAATLRNRLIETLEVADSDCFVQMRQPLLTFVVAGGGFAGVETAGAVSDFLRDAKRHYPNLRSSRSRVVLVHSGPTLLPELDPKLGAYAARKLAEHGVDVRLNTRVSGAADGCVTLSDNTDIPASSLVWTARTCAHPLIDTLPCARERGRVRVAPFLQVPDWPGVWAVGDAAHIPDPNGKPYPPTAQHALREGKIVARNITAAVQNSARREAFAFSTIGQLASIGRRRGVASVLGVHFSGFRRLVAVAHRVSEQTAAFREETARRARLDAGPVFQQGPGPVHHRRPRSGTFARPSIVKTSRNAAAANQKRLSATKKETNPMEITPPNRPTRVLLGTVAVATAAAATLFAVPFSGSAAAAERAAARAPATASSTPAPELVGGPWLNTASGAPIKLAARRGKVTLVQFWTFGCINCRRNLPAYARLHQRFAPKDVALIGVHTPEFAHERDSANVARFVKQNNIAYPILLDAKSENWKRWKQEFWPTVYVLDKQNRMRYRWEGELAYNGATGERTYSRW